MNEQTKIALREEPLPAVSSDAASIMAVISRAASDPSVDVGKLERLMGLYERIADDVDGPATETAKLAEFFAASRNVQ